MENELPDWLRGNARGSKLRGLDDVDTGKVKPWKVKNFTPAVDQIDKLVPLVYAPNVRKPQFADPDWLLKCDPRPVQLEALRRSYGGFALWDDPEDMERFRVLRTGDLLQRGFAFYMEQRLGKTPVCLNEYELFRRDRGVKWLIVVAPMSYKPMWPIEAETFGSSVPGHTYDASKKKHFQQFVWDNKKWGGIISFNFESARAQDLMGILSALKGEGVYIAADESIKLKNPFSDQSKALLDLAKGCAVRRDLSGKPITQGAHDMYQQMRFIGHLNGTMYADFKAKYCKLGGHLGKAVVGMLNGDILREIMEPHMFIARRAVWMKTPGKEYVTRSIGLKGQQAALYKQMSEELIVEVNGKTITADQIITKMLKLQQIRSGHIKDEDGTTHDLMPVAQNPLLQDLKEWVDDEITSKIIIVAHYKRTLDMLMELFPDAAVIRAKDWHKKNKRVVEEEKEYFNKDQNCRVMVAAARVVKYGHTLTGTVDDPCLNMVFFENDYSLDTRSQDEDRPVHADQPGVLTLTDYICSQLDYDTISALQRKEDVASAFMGFNRAEGVLPYSGGEEG